MAPRAPTLTLRPNETETTKPRLEFKMKASVIKRPYVSHFLCAFLANAFCMGNAFASEATFFTATNFEQCNFTFANSEYFSLRPAWARVRSSSDRDYCSLYMDTQKIRNYTPKTSVWITILSHLQIEEIANAQGFYKESGETWKFKGSSLGIYFVSFKKLSLEQQKVGNDLILIGRQIERAKDQVGTPITFEGVHILRITPTYLVRMDLPFYFETKASTRDAIVKDMIKLVEGVHVTTKPLAQ